MTNLVNGADFISTLTQKRSWISSNFNSDSFLFLSTDGTTLHSKYIPELSPKTSTQEAGSQSGETSQTFKHNGLYLSTMQRNDASSTTSTTSSSDANAYANADADAYAHAVYPDSFQPLPTSFSSESRQD